MLNRRAHILFEEEDFNLLELLAVEKGSSVGELVRKAVKRAYVEPKDEALERRKKGFQRLIKWQEKIGVFEGLNYKALVEYGRVR